jgi:predicted CoA-substrate-specific enzyme activase
VAVDLVAGIDVGSHNVTTVLLGPGGLLGHAILASAEEGELAARRSLERACAEAGCDPDPRVVVATGCGRAHVSFASRQSSEVVCQARGAHELFPEARSVLNLGAESSRAVRVAPDGRATAFATNDKCAAGSGRFLELMARLLEVPLEQMGELAQAAGKAAEVSSRCTVFAESEVISHIHRGVPRQEILAGIHAAVVDRIVEIAGRIEVEPEVAVSGGLALNRALWAELESRLSMPLLIPPEPRIVGALGAALVAASAAA